ncbi:hypothetical protein Tco_0686266 [Tanacetum coccineum]
MKISSTNLRIDPNLTQKEDTYQVVLDILRNTSFYKAFTATTDVQEIFMQQFWFTIANLKNSAFYEFKRANKICLLDVEVFLNALNYKTKQSLSLHHEFRKSPTAELFDVESRRIFIRHYGMLKSISLNVLAKSQG